MNRFLTGLLPAKSSFRSWVLGLFLLVASGVSSAWGASFDSRGGQFVGLSKFGGFTRSKGSRPGEVMLTSPVLRSRIAWNELILSWNAACPAGAYLRLEARALYPERATKYYSMGLWSTDPARFPRESVPDQKDSDGDVSTDTLRLQQPAQRLQIRLTLGGEDLEKPEPKFLGICLSDTRNTSPPLPPDRAAWDKWLPVPERSQMAYPNGKVLCSPTTVSMLMAWWAKELGRPELDCDVPEIVNAIYDSQWKGTGNWAFNMAFAGSCRGMRAYVTRMSDISELEEWLADGMPVGLSLCYDRLRGKGPGPNGHLVVCVGFTANGDPIINDPGTSKNVRKIFSRKNLEYAWSYSNKTVYLVYPEGSIIPKDRFGHWDSWTAHTRIDWE